MTPFLITTPTNIRYLTGFVGVAPEEREAYVLWVGDRCYLFTNPLYIEEARELQRESGIMNNESWRKQVQVIEISREKPLSKELATILASLKKDGIPDQVGDDIKLEYEEENVTVAELTKLKKELKGVKLTPTRGKIEEMRMIKREDEVASIREACTITDQCFLYLLAKLTPGVEERTIALEIEMFFRKRGAGLAFSPIVAFGKNSSKPHYNPNFSPGPFDSAQGKQSGILQNQDVALFDFGARVNGYCADMTHVVFIGTPKEEWRKAYEAVAEAQEVALSLMRQEIRDKGQGKTLSGAALDRASRNVIEQSGFVPYSHSLGHGVGLDIHETPRLTVKKDQMLKPGMVVSVEPGIYKEGAFGIRIEDLVLIKENGIEMLTKSKKGIVVN